MPLFNGPAFFIGLLNLWVSLVVVGPVIPAELVHNSEFFFLNAMLGIKLEIFKMEKIICMSVNQVQLCNCGT